MKLFGISIGQEKAVPFPDFRDMVRLAVRRSLPGAKIESTEVGFNITQDKKSPTACNLRSLYLDYTRKPGDREMLISRWVSSLTMEVPEHTWSEAMMTLRPTLKPAEYLASAHRAMQRNTPPDSLPSVGFAGELSVIIMRELPGTVVGVTQSTLESWNVSFADALKQSMNNMNMTPLPTVNNALHAGGGGRKNSQGEEVGLVFEGDHLTATWIIMERFRDYVIQRLQGDIVFSLPTRNRIVAIRADEPGLIQQIISSGRNALNQTHALTNQLFHVSSSTTGGLVTVYQKGVMGGANQQTADLDPNSIFAHGGHSVASTSTPPPTYQKQGPIDLSSFGGLSENTGD